MQHFCNGLSIPKRTLIDASARGAILGKNEVEAYQILENIALNNCQWPIERVALKKLAGVHDLDAVTTLSTQITSLSKQLQNTQLQSSQVSANLVQASHLSCDSCRGHHPTMECQMVNTMGELTIKQAQYLAKFPPNQNFSPYSPNYNTGWKNHPNFSWRNQNAMNPMEQVKPPLAPQEKKSSLDEKIEKLADMQIEKQKSQH